MAETERSDAQRRREEARRHRRESQATAEEPQEAQEPADVGADEDSHTGLKQAAKVAAAGAAVGAAVGAALAGRDGHPEEDDEDTDAATEEPAAEQTAVEKPEADVQPEATAEPEVTGEREEPQAEAPPKPREETPRHGASPDETVEVVRRAREQLQALQGREAESVSSLERTAEGWTVALEVVELPRVPNSTDVMASYGLLLDEDKNVIRFTRGRRYYRSQADRDGSA